MINHKSLHADGQPIRSTVDQLGSAGKVPAKRLSLAALRGVCLSLLVVASMTVIAQAQNGKKPCDDPYTGCKDAASRPRPKGKPKPPPRQLLAIKWQIIADKKGLEVPIDLNNPDWSNVDGVRLLVQVNQPGYLYIVSQIADKNNDLSQPLVIFSGGNAPVAKDSVIDLPPASQTRYKYNGKFWSKVTGSSGRPIVTVLFCRDQIDGWDTKTAENKDKELGLDYRFFLGLIQNTVAPKRKGLSVDAASVPGPSGFRNSLTTTQTLLKPGISGSFITVSSTPSRAEDEVLAEIIEVKRK